MRPSGRTSAPSAHPQRIGLPARSNALPAAALPNAVAATRRAPVLQSLVIHNALPATDSFNFSLPGALSDSVSFAPPEHKGLGDAATAGERIGELDLGDGVPLSFGDVVALSGDYFASASDMRKLAATADGRAELRFARWSALSREGPEPQVSAEVKQRVRTRYFALAADNSGHFSHGGTAIANYANGHAAALRKAHQAGITGNAALFASAVTDEACCQHFLSDSFSAGHVRTPVIAVRDFYRHTMPDSITKILGYAAGRVAQALSDRGDVPWYWPSDKLQAKVLETIERTAGPIVESFSLGDIVVLSCHNADDKGLDVVSDVDASGATVPGGFHWRAMGDTKLEPDSITWNMAVAAMRASRAELDEARAAGARGVDAPATQAERFIPREDEARNPPITWRWGTMDRHMIDAIDACLRGQLLDELRSNKPNPAIQRFNRWGQPDPQGSVELHVGDAYEAFCHELETDGIKALERAIGTSATTGAPIFVQRST